MPGPARSGWRAVVTTRRVVTTLVVIGVLAALVVWIRWPSGEPVRSTDAMVTVRSGPERNEPIELDTTIYVPESATASHPAPAILLAHGFGGSKSSVAADARRLAGQGYVVQTWSARGFGRSGGTISLDSPDYEVNDARALVDRLAERDDVRQDASGDPRVAAIGGSYGGALSLLLAGYDKRVDTIVPRITWNDLANSFFPEATGGGPADGVFKRSWAGLFFGSASGGGVSSVRDLAALLGARPDSNGGIDPSSVDASKVGELAQCGRFEVSLCREYLEVATTGRSTPAIVERLRRSSPSTVLDRIDAPTLLVQGQQDTLFPLSEADANARGIAANGTPVRVAWYAGGHDSTASTRESERVNELELAWLRHYLDGRGPAPSDEFSYTTAGAISARDTRPTSRVYTLGEYPPAEDPYRIRVSGISPQPVANPPDGTPAGVSTLPGFGALTSSFANAGIDVPGQFASYSGVELSRSVDVAGAPTVRVAAASPTGEAVLFLKLYDVDADGRATLPGGAVSAVRLTGLPRTIDTASLVTVTLPMIGHRFESGHSVRLVIATADQAYAGPVAPAVYQVAVQANSLHLPAVTPVPVASSTGTWTWVLIGLLGAVGLGVVAAVVIVRARRRRLDVSVDSEAAGSPLVVRGLRKAYGDGYLAVRDLSFSVEPGQVVGLLGPNGAGKTTTLRMLMGLIRPTGGEILVFGHRIVPGAPVLSRIGAFVEGPGLLPHLSGLENLHRYWQATGRPAESARLEEALEIAGLGAAVHRKVKTYSQGMRQRLAIAQAMLGLPDLLVLDEPTNGLDPPQIAEMRAVLSRYATDGRAVLVSSHLLAEVEQVCSHVVVVSKGTGVAAGPVGEIVGEGRSVLVEVASGDQDAAVAALRAMPGVEVVHPNGAGLVVELAGVERSDVVRELVGAGVGVERLVARRRLEDVFLELVGEQR
ncbi:CocE/NonD family hydrolase [Cryptosporangium arvum]|uniref:Putative hydrolase, CocE/NonD family n=1 Tax=Cryptosporangium arvum DSM 44712 TaxID=927661 RepID=A0A010YWG2_9ACTN|nr:putative hydrolase, CocE/NonD family [Cryptosporangium arvum DSM 44712]